MYRIIILSIEMLVDLFLAFFQFYINMVVYNINHEYISLLFKLNFFLFITLFIRWYYIIKQCLCKTYNKHINNTVCNL